MAEGRLQKPQLRNLHLARTKRSLVTALTLCAFNGLCYKLFVVNPYEQKVTQFYKTYDVEEHLKQMNEAGLMESWNRMSDLKKLEE